MANIVTNKLYILTEDKDELNKVLEFIKRETEEDGETSGIGTIDFNKITPMPPWVIKEASIEDGIIYGEENCDIGWMNANWGTKGNAFDISYDSDNNLITFSTYWNPVLDLIVKLARIFPQVTLNYKWLDEVYGGVAGKIKIKGKYNEFDIKYVDVFNSEELDAFITIF